MKKLISFLGVGAIILASLFASAAKPIKPLPGTITASPNPVSAGQIVTLQGSNIISKDGSIGGAWLAFRSDPSCSAGTTFTGTLVDPDNTFTKTWTFYVPCSYTIDVYEGFGGPSAKKLATTTLIVQ